MRKKTKTEIHMIDMNSRKYVRIVESTIEERENLQRDLDEVQLFVEERMRQYEQHIRTLISNAVSEGVVTTTQKDAKYFIETYKNEFENRNKTNIQNRINQLQKYIKEQEN